MKIIKRKSNKANYKLKLIQNKQSIKVTGLLNGSRYQVVELWLHKRDDRNFKIKIAEQKPSNYFDMNIYYDNLFEVIGIQEDNFNELGEVYDWYFKVRCKKSLLPLSKLEDSDTEFVMKSGCEYGQYFVRCGRFQKTEIEGLKKITYNSSTFEPYITTNGNLSLSVNKELVIKPKLQIDKIKRTRNSLTLIGPIFTQYLKLSNIQIYVNGRQHNSAYISDQIIVREIQEYSEKKFGQNKYYYEATIDLNELQKNKEIEEDIYDLFFDMTFLNHEETIKVRVGNPTFRARIFTREIRSIGENVSTILNPYYTFKQSNFSFEVYNYQTAVFKYMKRLLRFSYFIKLFNKNKDVWIVGERTYKAQDTGYSFFKYMRENHPDKNVYYVIEADSPERKNVEKYGNVLDYKSKEHVFQTIISRKVISSHHPDYLYPLRTPKFKGKIKADKVFLQHGVMGTKNMVANYGKNAYSFDTDLFMVSSEFEKNMIVKDFGYSPKNVFVTGLSRFDQLFKEDVALKRQVLVIPTWRDWIYNEEVFLESEYFERYKKLIESDILKKLSIDYNFEIVFCLHPNMQMFSHLFNDDHIKVVNQGEIDVQHLIKQSSMMITDYSSVGFDFSFLYKPVIYYQFDRNRFIGKRGSHLDLDNDLPGKISSEQNDIIEWVRYYAKNNFKMDDQYKKRTKKFIKYRDKRSSERIYEVINNNTVKKSWRDNTRYRTIVVALYQKFRKSKKYFPIMKVFYNIGRRIIPVDKKMILFESNIGRQIGDSPKVIYDEIIKRNLDFKKVWVYSGKNDFEDSNTIVIKRLSPYYYYYLFKSGYWVNNQNFPSYLKKRKETKYLQTWHGTPLKKMLFDIENVHGRSEDYVERIGEQIKNWDYLISPSSYATQAFRSAFKYEKEVLEVGYPRNDIFYQDEKQALEEIVRNRLRLNKDKKIILYAPTFRDNHATKNNKFDFNLEMDLLKMKENLSSDYIVLLRMHVAITSKLKLDEDLSEFVMNVSDYPDMQELLLITDILITDYSSVMFDFANTGKPMLFFTYDLETYRDDVRGFYMDFEIEAPGPLIKNTEEIIDKIQQIDKMQNEYKNKYEQFYENYCYNETGESASRVVKKVFVGKS